MGLAVNRILNPAKSLFLDFDCFLSCFLNQPIHFIDYKRLAWPVESKKRVSSFGVARIIISAPTPLKLQASQLSPTFRTWLIDFVESRLKLDESAESLGYSFDLVIPEEGSSFEHDQEIYPDNVSHQEYCQNF
ncbi:hypothetical protein VP01_3889g1 [Puccinia sorghi]|uniref:Uncharacterized protein n=1 Tax=Puccinia sorghi TaxID=27349 RepID=A0A0L6UUR7_9BASI|nr:hypothetical protein VP01_3889g1 [Puccinia sorghi]